MAELPYYAQTEEMETVEVPDTKSVTADEDTRGKDTDCATVGESGEDPKEAEKPGTTSCRRE